MGKARRGIERKNLVNKPGTRNYPEIRSASPAAGRQVLLDLAHEVDDFRMRDALLFELFDLAELSGQTGLFPHDFQLAFCSSSSMRMSPGSANKNLGVP